MKVRVMPRQRIIVISSEFYAICRTIKLNRVETLQIAEAHNPHVVPRIHKLINALNERENALRNANQHGRSGVTSRTTTHQDGSKMQIKTRVSKRTGIATTYTIVRHPDGSLTRMISRNGTTTTEHVPSLTQANAAESSQKPITT